MKYRKRLQNPFVLVGQGFVLGGILFFATHTDSPVASAAPAASPAGAVAPVQSGR